MIKEAIDEEENGLQWSVKPLKFRNNDEIESNRLVLHRDDNRMIKHEDDVKKKNPGYYVVEVSRSKLKMYIVAVKI
jgi:hypothetical protein